MESDESSKRYFISMLKEIDKAKRLTIEILRKHSLCNIKVIERAGKSVKDPNPLSSMLMAINQKYPISVKRSVAKSTKLPTRFLQDEGRTLDMHDRSRILCKLEAIDWWIDVSPLPNELTIDTINLLYKKHKDEAKLYYSIDWLKPIKFGQTNIERKKVNTNQPLINIKKQDAPKLIEQCLFPDSVIPYTQFPESILNKAKEIIKISLTDQMTIISQMRILLNQFDSGTKTLPVIPGISESISSIQHALYGSNYKITQLKIKQDLL